MCTSGHMFLCLCVYVFVLAGKLGQSQMAAADILVCFNPLANKTTGNHQKTPPAGQGEEHGIEGEEEEGKKRR